MRNSTVRERKLNNDAKLIFVPRTTPFSPVLVCLRWLHNASFESLFRHCAAAPSLDPFQSIGVAHDGPLMLGIYIQLYLLPCYFANGIFW